MIAAGKRLILLNYYIEWSSTQNLSTSISYGSEGYDIITMIRSLLRRTAASSSYARRYMLVGATSTLSTDYFHIHQITYTDNNLRQQNRQLSSRVHQNNNNSRAGRTGGRDRGRFVIDKSSGRKSGRG